METTEVKVEIGKATTGRWFWCVYRVNQDRSWRSVVSGWDFPNRNAAKEDFKRFREDIQQSTIIVVSKD